VSPAVKVAVKVVVVVAALAALALVWIFTPIRELATPEELQRRIAPLTSSPLLPLYTLLAFVVAGALFLSVWLLIFQTSLLFSPAAAFPLALAGSLLSASLFYGLGKALGQDVVVKWAPLRVQTAVRGAGLESIIAVRLLPVLPFTFVNMCCGAFGVRFGTFVVGTAVGMTPGILGMSLLGERLLAVIRQPTPLSIGALVGVAAVLVVGASWFRRSAARRVGGAAEPAVEGREAAAPTSPGGP
jgi:uncharacterized membrane protein YdjX (TVP38/TMEM64 family)